MSQYSSQLRDPRWQKKRLVILEAAEWKCQRCRCETKELQCHHLIYRKGVNPWDYKDGEIVALCDDCHKGVSEIKARFEEELLSSMMCCGDFSGDYELFIGYLIGGTRQVDYIKGSCFFNHGVMLARMSSEIQANKVASRAVVL